MDVMAAKTSLLDGFFPLPVNTLPSILALSNKTFFSTAIKYCVDSMLLCRIPVIKVVKCYVESPCTIIIGSTSLC